MRILRNSQRGPFQTIRPVQKLLPHSEMNFLNNNVIKCILTCEEITLRFPGHINQCHASIN